MGSLREVVEKCTFFEKESYSGARLGSILESGPRMRLADETRWYLKTSSSERSFWAQINIKKKAKLRPLFFFSFFTFR